MDDIPLPSYHDPYLEGFAADRISLFSQARSRAPPAYGDIFSAPTEFPPNQSPHTAHERSVCSGLLKKTPWLMWRVISRATHSQKAKLKCPRYFGGDYVQGEIELRLDKPQSINSIDIVLRGKLITSVTEQAQTFHFLEHTHTVWTRTDGDPRNSTPPDPLSPPKKFEGKLSGDYDLSFSFPFPVDVDVARMLKTNRRGSEALPVVSATPQTLLEPSVELTIEYDLVLRVNHGFLFPDSKSIMHVLFIPEITPAPASPLRQASYAEDAMIPGPTVDPEGWVTLRPLKIHATFQKRNISLLYSFSLSKPLSYTRGSVIPCYIEIACADEAALDELASPRAQRVRLLRRITYYPDPVAGVEEYIEDTQTGVYTPSPRVSDSRDAPAVRDSQRRDSQEAEVGVFWTAAKDPNARSILSIDGTPFRRLDGEIHLAKELVPSSNFVPCSVEYFVQTLPFRVVDFRLVDFEAEPELPRLTNTLEPQRRTSNASVPQRSNNVRSEFRGTPGPTTEGASNDLVLESTAVNIATFYPHGPRPKVFSQRAQPSMANRRPNENSDSLRQLNTMFGFGL